MNQKASNHTDPLGLAALGIVFGDIGTSPLYTLKTVLSMTVGTPTARHRAWCAVADRVDVNHHHIGEICHLCHEYRQ